MKTTTTFILTGALATFASCTYVEDPDPGVSTTTRDTTTTVTDYDTGETATTRRTTTHYPDD